MHINTVNVKEIETGEDAIRNSKMALVEKSDEKKHIRQNH